MNTIKDVAKLSQTSISTVSRVINGKSVKKVNYDKIIQAIETLDYSVNTYARTLKTNRTMTIGLVIPDFTNPYFSKLAKALQNLAYKRGYYLFLLECDKSPEDEKKQVEILVNRRVDGIIIAPSGNSGLYLKKYKDVHMVILDEVLQDIEQDFVVLQNHAIVYEATNLFIANGHKKIGIITGPGNYSNAKERIEGYMHALVEHDIPVDKKYIKSYEYSVDSGYRAINEWFKFPDNEPPTAVLATSYALTKGAILAIEQQKISIPDDISFIGYDFEDLSQFYSPAILIVVENFEEIAKTTIDLLIKKINNVTRSGENQIYRIMPTLVNKESVGIVRDKPKLKL